MKRFFVFCSTIALLSLPVHAQSTQSLSEAEKRQKALIEQQQKATEQAQKLQAEAEAASTDLSSLQERLVNASTKERELSARLNMLQQRTKTLEQTQATLTTNLAGKRQNLAELLVGLARLSRLPPELGLLREGNTKDAINTALLLESSLPEVQKEARQLANSLNALDEVQKQLQVERTALADARRAQDKEQAQIEVMIRARQKKLKLTSAQRDEIENRLSKLRTESANVEDLMRKIASVVPGAAPKKSGKPAPVLALRGGFVPPSAGEVKRQYGQNDDVGSKSLGITFASEPGGRIVSPARGTVKFAGTFKGYGQIVIIQHEDDMHSLISGFNRLDVQMGQKVNQGEPLGVAGIGGLQNAKQDASMVDVYFELRHDGEPIDPRLHQR